MARSKVQPVWKEQRLARDPRASDGLNRLILANNLAELGYFAERKLPVGRDESKSSARAEDHCDDLFMD